MDPRVGENPDPEAEVASDGSSSPSAVATCSQLSVTSSPKKRTSNAALMNVLQEAAAKEEEHFKAIQDTNRFLDLFEGLVKS